MSYMRWGYPLKYFDGESKSYVFLSVPREEGGKDFVEDYDDDYKDNKSFIELIANIIRRETGDEEYAFKIAKTLAKKLKVPMKKKRLTDEEHWDSIVEYIKS